MTMTLDDFILFYGEYYSSMILAGIEIDGEEKSAIKLIVREEQ